MSIAFVQNKHAFTNSSSTTTVAVTLTSNTTAGNYLIVGLVWGTASGSVSNVKDNVDNTNFSQAGSLTQGNSNSSTIWYHKIATGGTCTITGTFASAVGFPELFAYEFSGIAASSPVDVTNQNNGTGTAITSNAATTTNANDLLFGCASTLVLITATETNWTGDIDATTGFAGEYRIVTATGSYAATFTDQNGTGWAASFASFFPAGSTVSLPSTTMQAALGITSATLKGLIAGGSVVQLKAAMGITTATLKGEIAGGATVNLQGKFGIAGQIGKLAIALANLKALLGIANAQSPGKATGQDRPYSMWGGGF